MEDLWNETLMLIADTAYDVIFNNNDKLKTNYKVYRNLRDHARSYGKNKNDPVERLDLIIYVLKRIRDDLVKNDKECGTFEKCISKSYTPRMSTYILDHILRFRDKTQEILYTFALNYKKYKDFYDRSNKG